MISDEERREVAQSLRHCSAYGDGANLSEWWARLQEVATGEVDFPSPRELFERLADLIDRPTCELVEAWDGEREQHCLDCTACHFGRRAIEQDDAGVWYNARELWCNVEYDDLTHCPYCGAEVVRDGN